MSKIETRPFRAARPAELFAALTAEAWLDPALARALAEDKAGTIARFAADLGLEVPPIEEIEAYTLPENPIGDVEIGINPLVITANTALEDGCPSTLQESCPATTHPACNASQNCGGGPGASWTPSNCSVGCSTFSCSANCPTVYYCPTNNPLACG